MALLRTVSQELRPRLDHASEARRVGEQLGERQKRTSANRSLDREDNFVIINL